MSGQRKAIEARIRRGSSSIEQLREEHWAKSELLADLVAEMHWLDRCLGVEIRRVTELKKELREMDTQ